MTGTTLTRPFGGAGAAAAPRDVVDDRRYCRIALPRVSRTFAINIRLLSGSFGEAVRTAYLLCRACDTLEDSWPGPPADVARRFGLFHEALHGDRAAALELGRAAELLVRAPDTRPATGAGRAELDLVSNLDHVLGAFETLAAEDRAAIQDALDVMAAGMRRYAVRAAERQTNDVAAVPYLDTEAELHDYCWVVAGCVGVMLTRLFTRRAGARDTAEEAHRMTLAPTVGEALQLTNILLDWPLDVRRGRCHVPARWLDEAGLTPAELAGDMRSSIRAIAERLEALARAALARVPEYLDTVPGRHVRYRMFCLWPALWALGSLHHARRDPAFPTAPSRPRLPRSELWRAAMGSLLVAHDGRAVRRLMAAAG